MNEYEIILKRLDEIRQDIQSIFKKLDENEKEIFNLKQSLTVNDIKFSKDINGLKDCYEELKNRPTVLKENIKFMLYIISTLLGNGALIMLLKIMGVLK